MAALPQEVVEEILSRLPAKSLLKFKSASRKWYSLISKNHKFSKFHLDQSFSECKNLIFYRLCIWERAIFQYSDVGTYQSRRINFPVEIATPCKLIGSANGLVCVASLYKEGHCYIWNPCTDEFKRISIATTPAGYKLFGFGYDSISDDYKIIGDWDFHLRVFSLKENSWKMLDYSFQYAGTISALYSNGHLNWCCGLKITAFDLSKDQIVSMDLPKGTTFVGRDDCSWVPLFNYRGWLCASGSKFVWVMKEYGNPESWVKLSTPLPEEYAKPVCVSRVGELVFCKEGGFVKSDIPGRMSDEDRSQMVHYGDAFLYRESLISPKCLDP